jgi:hypothetical protein
MMNAVGIIQTILTCVVETRIAREMTHEFKATNTKPSFDNIFVNMEPLNDNERSRYNSYYIKFFHRN